MSDLKSYLVAFLLAVFAIVTSGPSQAMGEAAANPQSLETQGLMIRTARGKQHFFTVELADEPHEQKIGLMHRTSLDGGAGMLFTHEVPRVIGMWMKNTLIPLDMVFIGEAGRVLNVAKMTVPQSLTSVRSAGPAVAVLEIKGGRADELDIGPGDVVFHCRFENFPCQSTPPQAE